MDNVLCTKPNKEAKKQYYADLAAAGNPIGGLYWVDGGDYFKKMYGPTMILLDVVNGKGKFCTQNRSIVWEMVSLSRKVNYNLPHYHGGDPDYYVKQNKMLDARGIGVP